MLTVNENIKHNLWCNHRKVEIVRPSINARSGAEGSWYFTSDEELSSWPDRFTDKLVEGAKHFPDRTLLAQRDQEGHWIRISYKEMLVRVRSIGQALLKRNVSVERPILILSGNDLAHAQLALGAMYVGIPYCPVSPANAIVSRDYKKLCHIIKTITPGLVYASDGDQFAHAIQAVVPDDTEVVVESGCVPGRKASFFHSLIETPPENVDEKNLTINQNYIAKFLFTSGSTALPKAVITTHRMLCANQQMLRQTLLFLKQEPPVLLDWLPWSHTFGGSHNFGMTLYNGGTLYINDGKPTAEGMKETLQNIKSISPTLYLDVPKGWEHLTSALESDTELRKSFYANMKLFFFAGAGLSKVIIDRLNRITKQHCGEKIRIMSGLGMTETAPSCLFTIGPVDHAGYVGLPAPGCEVKLANVEGKLEARFRGPHVMPGYWRAQEKTRGAFDEEGFYCSGDALRLFDSDKPEIGLMFDGRLVEDFKLNSGTFVNVAGIRARLLEAGAPYIQHVAVVGINQNAIGVLVFPVMEHCAQLAKLPVTAMASNILKSSQVTDLFSGVLQKVNQLATGSASRIAFLHLLEEAPSASQYEITEKGNINQRAVLKNRELLIESLYQRKESRIIE